MDDHTLAGQASYSLLLTGAEASIRLHFFTRNDRWAAIPGLTRERRSADNTELSPA